MCFLRKRSTNTLPKSIIVCFKSGFSAASFAFSDGTNLALYRPSITIITPITAMMIVQATTVPLCFAAAAAVALSPVRSPV